MSCSSRRNKNCNRVSCQRYYNREPQALAAGATLQLTIAGTRVVDSGISIDTQPQAFETLKTGLYHLAADVVIEAEAAGTVTLQYYMDGVALPCTLRTFTLAATGDREIHTETDLELTGCCCDVSHTFTLVMTSPDAGAGTVNMVCAAITKFGQA